MKKLSEINWNINPTTILVAIILIIIILFGWKYYSGKTDKLTNKLETETKLRGALLDSVKTYQNKEHEWVSEKLTIQETVNNINNMSNQLNASQKELLSRVIEIQKKNSIITAALIRTNIMLDSLRQGKVAIDSTDKNITFSDSLKNIQYKILISHAIPAFKDIAPRLTFQKFLLPNTQFIEFHWKNNKSKDYPISFSVSNSNEYFKVVDINSYAIPQLQKDVVNPNAWQRFTSWVKKSGNFAITVGVSAAAGATAVLLLK